MNAKWLLLWGFVLTIERQSLFRAMGRRWAACRRIISICVAINSSGDIFVGTYDGGGYRSTNGGNGWVMLLIKVTIMCTKSTAWRSPLRNVFAEPTWKTPPLDG